MHNQPLDIESSIEWLKDGKFLLHPTEGIWGIGCDALNEKAIANLYTLKKRPNNKSFILLVKSIKSIEKYLIDIPKNERDYLKSVWPGHSTILIKYNKKLPMHLQNNTGKLAIRVSNHLPIKLFFKRFSGILVSTSANISDHPPMNNPVQILETFGNKDLAYYDAELGTSIKPSTIIDLETRKIIRE